MAMGLHPIRVVRGLLAGAVELERAALADGVGPLEDPVLPQAEPGEDLRLDGFRPGEAQVGLEAAQRIRREAGELLDRDADLVIPIDLVGSEGDEAEPGGCRGVERPAGRGLRLLEALWRAEEADGETAQVVAHRQRAEIHPG